MKPEAGSKSPSRASIYVVFPDPDASIIAVIFLDWISISMFFKAGRTRNGYLKIKFLTHT